MKTHSSLRTFAALIALLGGLIGCTKERRGENAEPSASHAGHTHEHAHEHHAPHDGTPVVLGDEAYHLELVLDAADGKLQAYVMDGELENFVRCATPSFEIVATVAGTRRTLLMAAVVNPATGETVGDTSLFEARADWLKSTVVFDGTVTTITIRGTTFNEVRFNFPKGNERE